MSEKYCVMNMKKNKRADVNGLQEEANRELEEYKNEVKKELTHTNYFFVKTDDWNKKITEILEENGLDENDIVNIGLHFFLKNVRPHAASCSEA